MENLKIQSLAKKIEENQYVPTSSAPLNFEECLKVAEQFVKLIKTVSKKEAFENSIGFTVKPQTDIAFQPRNHIANF